MLHKAWNSKGEMPYCFPRSSIKFQGHTVQNITDFDPNRAFPDYRPVAAFKSLRFALFIQISLIYVPDGTLPNHSITQNCFGKSLGPNRQHAITFITYALVYFNVYYTHIVYTRNWKCEFDMVLYDIECEFDIVLWQIFHFKLMG